ncbi:MAG: hypothetical protein IJ140_02365, partial [Prevotella sp.]|nr:hypothetical protein [Prevotella sp.]
KRYREDHFCRLFTDRMQKPSPLVSVFALPAKSVLKCAEQPLEVKKNTCNDVAGNMQDFTK